MLFIIILIVASIIGLIIGIVCWTYEYGRRVGYTEACDEHRRIVRIVDQWKSNS